jgi:hypothetical protein
MGKQRAEDVEAGDLFSVPTRPPQLTRSATLAIDSPARRSAFAVQKPLCLVYRHVAKFQTVV